MKQLLLLCLSVWVTALFAQDHNFNPYFQLQADQSYYLLADNVNVRAKPDLKADLVNKIPIGTKLTLIETDENFLEINGLEAPWCKVSFQEGGSAKSGYIWGGYISLTAESYNLAGGELLLLGISKIADKKDGEYTFKDVTMQLRVCRNNKEIQKLEFSGNGSSGTSRSFSLKGGSGVKGVTNIVNVEYSDNYCGGSFGNHIFFWDGKKIVFVKHLQSGADAPCFSSEDFIFPEEEGGKAGILLIKSEAACDENVGNEDNPEGYETVYEYRRMEEYSWKNNKLVLLKKYDIK